MHVYVCARARVCIYQVSDDQSHCDSDTWVIFTGFSRKPVKQLKAKILAAKGRC